jgi:APA family basic amino acid/polyamine antiporter
MLLTSSFAFIITSVGVILSVFTTLTAIGLIIMRIKHPETARPIKVPLYPITPLLFIIFNLFTIGYFVVNKPTEALAGMVFLVVGFIIYLFLSPQHHEK